jgi:putative transposase
MFYCGRRFRAFNILDEGGREVLAIEVDISLPAEWVILMPEQMVAWRDQPQAIWLDNAEHTPSDREPRITVNFGVRRHTISIEGK